MGYAGLSHWSESDNAADALCNLTNAVDKAVHKELANHANCYNTEGIVNILLICEDKPGLIQYMKTPTIQKIIKEGEEKIATITERWDASESKDWHLKEIRRMLESFKKLAEPELADRE